MARTGRFGRLPGPGYDYSSIVGSLLAQYENARNANILSAWRDGGKFEGKKVTDARLLEWFRMRRDEYDKDDPEWDKWNQQITQFRYDIAEQKMMLAYARENIGEFGVARWYQNSASQFPRNSQAWRDAMINAARYRKAGQEKAAAARRAASANAPSRTELYQRETREVTRTHIEPANRAIEWWGRVLQGSNVTSAGEGNVTSWDSANIDALSGGHRQVMDWIMSDDPHAIRLRDWYEKRFGHEFNFRHFMGVIHRGQVGSDLQIGIARKYKYHSAIPQLRSNKQAYTRYERRAKMVRQDKWTEYLDAQADAEAALAEATSPEEKERIRQELAAELAPIQRWFQRRGEDNAAFVVGETIDAATGGEVAVSADLSAAPWGETGTNPRVKPATNPDTGKPYTVTNDFNSALAIQTATDRAQIAGLADGTYIRVRNSETGQVEVVPREQYPDISSTHYLDNILAIAPGITIDGTKYPARSNAAYVAWQPGQISVSHPDDPFISTDYTPEGINEFAVAETIDGELVYRYSKPDGSLYIGPVPPFDERIDVFGFSNGKVKVSGQQIRLIDPNFMNINQTNASGTPISSDALNTQAKFILGKGAGSRSEVFTVNQQPEEETPPVTAVDRTGTPPEVTRLREQLAVEEAAVAEYRGNREELQGVGKGTIIGSLGDLAADIEYNQEGLDRLEAKAQQTRDLITNYESNPQATRDIIAKQLQDAEAKVREWYDSGEGRFEGGDWDRETGQITGSPQFVADLQARNDLVEKARSVGIDVQVDQQDFFITGPGMTVSTAVRTSVPDAAVEPPYPLVDKPPVYSPVLTQSSNPLAPVVASESQWRFLRTLSPEDARIVYDTIIVSNGWEDDGAAQARLAHSFEAVFMAGEAGDTHLEWMRNYPGTSLQEAQEMASRMAFFRERRQELDDSGVDFWEGIDQNDLRAERRRLAIGDPSRGLPGLTEEQIDEQFPWLAGARDPDTIPQPQGPGLEDPGWQPLTADLDMTKPLVVGRTSRPITAVDLMKDRPAAVQADAVSPQPTPTPVPDYDFTPPDPQQTAVPSTYQESRPSFVPQPTPTPSIPSAADIVATPPAVMATPVPVAAIPSAQPVPKPSASPVPQASYPPRGGGVATIR